MRRSMSAIRPVTLALLLVCFAGLAHLPCAGYAQDASGAKQYGSKKTTGDGAAADQQPATTPAPTPAAAPGVCPKCNTPVAPFDGQVVCQHCGLPLIMAQGAEGQAAGVLVPGLRLRPFSCMDTEGTGLEAFRMLVPVGWDIQGGLRWNPANPGMPVTLGFVIRNPNGPDAMEIFPSQNFLWNTAPLQQQLNPIGSVSMGAIVMPPMGAQQMLREFLIPATRGRNATIKSEKHLPDLAQQLEVARSNAADGMSRDGAKVRIEYQTDAGPVEEEIYGIVAATSPQGNPGFGQPQLTVWYATYLFSARAGSGRLDAEADLFRTLGSSVRLNPAWQGAIEQITVALCQNQIRNIRQIGEMGRAYAQQASNLRDAQLNDWYQRQEIKDGIMDDVSRTIRGVDAYYDPHKEQTVELPGGYGHAWANNLGEYIVTESTDFNPNIGSNLHWEPMEPR